jgi:hypothetical protein
MRRSVRVAVLLVATTFSVLLYNGFVADVIESGEATSSRPSIMKHFNNVTGPWPSKPYFFANGTYRAAPSPSRDVPFYPEESRTDRFLSQLMFKPISASGNLSSSSKPVNKKILVTGDFGWLSDGKEAFFKPIECQVTDCELVFGSVSSPAMDEADAVLFKDSIPDTALERRRINQVQSYLYLRTQLVKNGCTYCKKYLIQNMDFHRLACEVV